jgi:hypothetical protein
MTVFQAYQTGLSVASRQWKRITVVYTIQLVLVLLLSLQVFQVLEASIGKSLQINQLRDGYQHTVITDFLKVHGASITPLLGQLRWVLLIWLLVSAFLQGGLLYSALDRSSNRLDTFFSACSKFFFPTLVIGTSFLFGAVLSGALLLGPVLLNFQPMIDKYATEQGFLLWLAFALLLWCLILLMLYVWSILSKIAYMQGGKSIFMAIVLGWKALRGRLLTYCTISITAGLVLLAIWWIFQWLSGPSAYQSPWALVLVTFISQVIIWLRIWLRQVVYGAYAATMECRS